jgi:hypothetical protein
VQLPKATRLYCQYSGRMLYAIEDNPGLWQTAETGVLANNEGRARRFMRATEIEARLQAAMKPIAEPTP